MGGGIGIAFVGLAAGFLLGRYTKPDDEQLSFLPNGLPRTCCHDDDKENTDNSGKDDDDALTESQKELVSKLRQIAGDSNVLDGRDAATAMKIGSFLRGARLGGGGRALAVVTPTLLEDVVKCVHAIVDADCVILPQGSNTGLTGGSVPRPVETTRDTRPIVVLSMKKLDTIFPIDDGRRVVCLAGAGLATLSRKLPAWFPDRESHSVLGSTFLNPTAAAGIALGSGGTQIRKGPAYTDRAMYLQVSRNKFAEYVVRVVNRLGIQGLEDDDFVDYDDAHGIGQNTPVQQLDIYQRDVREGYKRAMAYSSQGPCGRAKASDAFEYTKRLCEHDHDVSRYNADCRGCDCNRSEGKVVILATVHDTFPRPLASKTFWLSFDSLDTALSFRRDVALHNPRDLPVSMEYLNRDAFDVIDRSGRILGIIIRLLGPSSDWVGRLWRVKLWMEALPFAGAPLWVDQILHALNPFVPPTLPARFMETGRSSDHHVLMTVGEFGSGTMDRLLDRMQHFAAEHGRDQISIVECQSASEVAALTAFRFIAATSFRTWCVGEKARGLSVDYALPKDGGHAPILRPPAADDDDTTTTAKPQQLEPLKRMRYSHFGCNVVHEDLAFAPGVDVHHAKMALKRTVELECHGKLPAEHGHGTEYHAPHDTRERWKKMDPLNVMNPGVGGLSYKYRYRD